MLQSQTAVLERNTLVSGSFVTEPFEVGWASEARWFFQALESSDDSQVFLMTQVSPDGITWTDLNDSLISGKAGSLLTWPAREFGHWLRIRGTIENQDASMRVLIYLALKG